MKTIEWTLNIGLVGCKRKGTFEVEDDTTEEEIEDIAKEEAFQYVNWDWHKIDEE